MTPERIIPKKSLGQHWLVNPGVLARIADTADVTDEDTVLEIGPGTGALTRILVSRGARVVAVEKDRRLIAPLRAAFASAPSVMVIEGDVLEFDPASAGLMPGAYKLVANIPYYLTSHLLRTVLERWPRPSVAVLMVQEEIARRMVAAPPDMNLLALSVQLFAQPETVMRVSRGSFRPVPGVDSAVVRLVPRAQNGEERERRVRVLALARMLFASKRKQLGSRIPAELLRNAGVPSTARPQELGITQWLALAG